MSATRGIGYLTAVVLALLVLIVIVAGISHSHSPVMVDSGLRRNPDGTFYLPASALTDDAKRAIASLKQRGLRVDAGSVASEIARAKSETSPAATVPAADLPPTVVPTNNEILFDAFPDSAFRRELTVDNGTSHHAVGKLIDVRTDQKVLSFVVGARQKCTIPAILGTYQLIFAFGDRLYEGTDRFCSPSGFFKFVSPMNFTTNSRGWSVTLHPVFDGNAKTSSISREEFERY